MISPPITRTNVLRMNVHFKAALEMYGQLSAYTKQGYELIEKKNVSRPLSDSCNAEIVQTALLQFFLAYKHGNKQEDELKRIYAQEEAEAFERYKQEVAAKLLAARQKLEEKQISPEEYILLQEERIKHLEMEEQALRKAEAKIEFLNETIAQKDTEIEILQDNVDNLKGSLMEKTELLATQAREFELKKKEIEVECQARVRQCEADCVSAKREYEAQYQSRVQEWEVERNAQAQAFETEKAEFRKSAELEKQEC